jgi:hypothetical protein
VTAREKLEWLVLGLAIMVLGAILLAWIGSLA